MLLPFDFLGPDLWFHRMAEYLHEARLLRHFDALILTQLIESVPSAALVDGLGRRPDLFKRHYEEVFRIWLYCCPSRLLDVITRISASRSLEVLYNWCRKNDTSMVAMGLFRIIQEVLR